MDRNYTMGAGIGLTGAMLSGFPAWPNRFVLGFAVPEMTEAFLTKHELYLVGSGFTPDSLGSVDPVIGDRPYGSIFGLSSRRVVVPIHEREEPGPDGDYEYYPVAIRTEVVLGLLGAGVSASIQTWIHEHNSSVVPLGWHNEISDGGEPTVLFKIQYERRLTSCIFGDNQPCGHLVPYQRRHFEVTTWVEGLAGYYTGAAAGLRGRIGWLSSEFWDFDGSPGSTIGQATGGGDDPQNRFELYGFVNMNGRGVLYNALLQGQFKSNPYDLDWSQVNKGIAEFQTGAVISVPFGAVWRLGLGYLFSGRTKEFSGAHARAHTLWYRLRDRSRASLILMPHPNDVPTPPPADRVTEVHPVRPGISISLSDGNAGTLGLFVVDSADRLFFLTARHVLGSGNPLGREVMQPGQEDGNGRVVAHIEWVNRRSDSALARVAPGFDCAIEQMGTGAIVTAFRSPRVNEVLTKSGRSTGVTHARVTKVDNFRSLPMAVFLERLDGDASAICRGGDSGALWYSEETGEGVGLHHDGKVAEGIAVAVPLPYIVSAYERRHNGPFEPWDGKFIDDEEATT